MLHQVTVVPSRNAGFNRDHEFNWTVESESGTEPRMGQYACGSWWVAPAIGETGVRLVSITGSNAPMIEELLQLSVNPTPATHGFLYEQTRSVNTPNTYGGAGAAGNIVGNLPQVFTADADSAISLVACHQLSESDGIPALSGLINITDSAPPLQEYSVRVQSSGGLDETVSYTLSTSSGTVLRDGLKSALEANANINSAATFGISGSGITYSSSNSDTLHFYFPLNVGKGSLNTPILQNSNRIARAGTKANFGSQAAAYNVLTVLSDAPAANGVNHIRPNICGDTKDILTWDDFDLDLVPTHPNASVPGGGPYTSGGRWISNCSFLGMSHWNGSDSVNHSEGGRAFKPLDLIADYAANAALTWNNTVMSLLSDNITIEGKKPLLAGLITFGINHWHLKHNMAVNPAIWGSGAGQRGDEFGPYIASICLLKDRSKINTWQRSVSTIWGSERLEQGPQILRQTHRGQTGVRLWGDGWPYSASKQGRYWSDMMSNHYYEGALGTPNGSEGQRTSADPFGYHEGPSSYPGSNYCRVNNGGYEAIACIMMLWPAFRECVNTDAPIEYIDRWRRVGTWTLPDPIAPPTETDQQNTCNPFTGGGTCVDYSILWGHQFGNEKYGVRGGANGRYGGLHGVVSVFSNESTLAQSAWNYAMTLYDGEKYEDYLVGVDELVRPDMHHYPHPDDDGKEGVYMYTASVEAEVRYTYDGSEPTENSPLFDEPKYFSKGTRIRSRTFKAGMEPSQVSEFVVGKGPEIKRNKVVSNVAALAAI